MCALYHYRQGREADYRHDAKSTKRRAPTSCKDRAPRQSRSQHCPALIVGRAFGRDSLDASHAMLENNQPRGYQSRRTGMCARVAASGFIAGPAAPTSRTQLKRDGARAHARRAPRRALEAHRRRLDSHSWIVAAVATSRAPSARYVSGAVRTSREPGGSQPRSRTTAGTDLRALALSAGTSSRRDMATSAWRSARPSVARATQNAGGRIWSGRSHQALKPTRSTRSLCCGGTAGAANSAACRLLTLCAGRPISTRQRSTTSFHYLAEARTA